MSQSFDELLYALSQTPGVSVEEKIKCLLAQGQIFSAPRSHIEQFARGLDQYLATCVSTIHSAGSDVSAYQLSTRLRRAGIDVSPQAVREKEDFYTPEYVAEQVHLRERQRDAHIPYRRRTRVSRS